MKSHSSAKRKAEALVKLGVTPYEAMVLAKASIMPATRKERVKKFTFTFGVEIECVHCPRYPFMDAASAKGLTVLNQGYNHTDIAQYKLVSDGSLTGENSVECVSPALNGNKSGFESLKKCCDALGEVGATVNRSCGLHVHIGAASLSEEAYCNVFVNYQKLEKVIDSFMALSRRGNNNTYSKSLQRYNLDGVYARSELNYRIGDTRYLKVNAQAWSRHRTIEFRQHQGTINFDKIKAWVTFLGKLVEWSRENRLTAPIAEIDDIPFLTQTEKNYFKTRKTALNG